MIDMVIADNFWGTSVSTGLLFEFLLIFLIHLSITKGDLFFLVWNSKFYNHRSELPPQTHKPPHSDFFKPTFRGHFLPIPPHLGLLPHILPHILFNILVLKKMIIYTIFGKNMPSYVMNNPVLYQKSHKIPKTPHFG